MWRGGCDCHKTVDIVSAYSGSDIEKCGWIMESEGKYRTGAGGVKCELVQAGERSVPRWRERGG